MKLSMLLDGVDVCKTYSYNDVDIHSISHDSREANSDGVYFAISGYSVDGKQYVYDAIKNGAIVIVTDAYISGIDGTIQVVVNSVRIAMSIVSKNYYGRVCDELKIISIVGTAGKTTTSMIVSHILSYCGSKCAVIGTNGIYIGGEKIDNTMTTPDPITLHKILKYIYDKGIEYVVIEVSAQAIYLDKMYGIKCICGVFTNISNEHLDFFKNIDDYASVKCGYFCKKNMDMCVINTDDKYGRRMYDTVDIEKVSIGIDEPSDVFGIDIHTSIDGTTFILNYLDSVMDVHTTFVGRYNVYNVMSAMTVCLMLGKGVLDVVDAVAYMPSVDGRMEMYEYRGGRVFIDFAHTPDSMDKALGTIYNLCGKDIVTLFGAVGYSDRYKRECMGRVVDKYSSKIVLTTDNVGDGQYIDIAKDILLGIEDKDKVILMEDREYAIRYAMSHMTKGDTLAILGKGHEDFQMIRGKRYPYSDKMVVQRVLSE